MPVGVAIVILSLPPLWVELWGSVESCWKCEMWEFCDGEKWCCVMAIRLSFLLWLTSSRFDFWTTPVTNLFFHLDNLPFIFFWSFLSIQIKLRGKGSFLPCISAAQSTEESPIWTGFCSSTMWREDFTKSRVDANYFACWAVADLQEKFTERALASLV